MDAPNPSAQPTFASKTPLHIGAVALAVRDLERMRAYYRDLLWLTEIEAGQVGGDGLQVIGDGLRVGAGAVAQVGPVGVEMGGGQARERGAIAQLRQELTRAGES